MLRKNYLVLVLLSVCYISIGSITSYARETSSHAGDLYSRDHHTSVLFKLNTQNQDSFMEQEGKRYSAMKYGDAESIEEYATMLAKQIWNQFSKEIKEHPDDWVLVCPSYFKAPTAAVVLARSTKKIILEKYKIDLPMVSIQRKSTNDREFGELKTMAERQSYIVDNFFYEGESLSQKSLIFIEDALVSGTHYLETQKVLKKQAGADLDNLYAFFVVEVEKEATKATNYEAEAVLNYGWINGSKLERLLPILKDPQTVYTPRMLKFVFGKPERANFYRKHLSFNELNKLYQTAYQESFLQKPKYKGLVQNLRADLTKQLLHKKKFLNLNAVYELDESTLKALLAEKNIAHNLVKGKISLAEMYSLLKFGDEQAIELFAHKIVEKMRESLITKWPLDPNEWGLCTTGYIAVTGAADILTKKISEIAGIPVVPSRRKESFSASYGEINSITERAKAVSGKFEFSAPIKKHMIYIDDAVASGSHVKEYQQLLAKKGAKTFRAFSIFDISSIDSSLENELNHSLIKTNDSGMLAAILSQDHSPILLRTIKTILSFEHKTLKSFVNQLDLSTLHRIHTAICDEGYDKKPAFSKAFSFFQAHLSERSGNLKL